MNLTTTMEWAIFVYIAIGCTWATYVVWRFYSLNQRDRLEKALADGPMTATGRGQFMRDLAKPHTFLRLFILMVTVWPHVWWRIWGRILVEHIRYRWARAKIIAEWQAQQKSRQ